MALCDFHLHSKYSFDSDQEMEPVCIKAMELGISKICFADHVEFVAPDAPWPDFSKRNDEIERLRDKYNGLLTIVNGVEIGQGYTASDNEKSFLEDNDFEFVIGSVHTMIGNIRPSRFSFDFDNYHYCFKKYFDDLRALAEETDYDVIAHVTFPFRYVPDDVLKTYPISVWEERFREVFEIIVKKNKVLEINTSGYRTKLNCAMPSLDILRWYKDCGGRSVSVGSDGHSVNSAFLYLKEGYDLAEAVGLEVIS